jgi:DNA-binding LytR/AlgR family response regulator
MEEMKYISLKPIILKTNQDFVYFEYDEIIMFEADGNCSIVYTNGSDSVVKILHTLHSIENKYCNEKLCRCHKSYIINLVHLEKLITRKRQVQLKKGLVAKLSPSWVEKIRQMSGLERHVV